MSELGISAIARSFTLQERTQEVEIINNTDVTEATPTEFINAVRETPNSQRSDQQPNRDQQNNQDDPRTQLSTDNVIQLQEEFTRQNLEIQNRIEINDEGNSNNVSFDQGTQEQRQIIDRFA